jgi:hypothetical protein
MQSPGWRLVDRKAELTLGELRAVLDPARPGDGLSHVSWHGSPLPGARLLGIVLPSLSQESPESLEESCVRGPLLVNAYRASEGWPVRVDAAWRPVEPSPHASWLAAMDLVLSVRTDRLDSRPELDVESCLPAEEVWRLVDPGAERFVVCDATSGRALELLPVGGTGCLVFRLPGDDLSYVEFVHPLDFHRDELFVGGGPDPSWRVRHRLFPGPLEKGVILRVGIRGGFCRREADLHRAAQGYTAFAGAEPPLSV